MRPLASTQVAEAQRELVRIGIDEVAGAAVGEIARCGSGYRASIAASILDRPGRDVVLINESYDAAKTVGLED